MASVLCCHQDHSSIRQETGMEKAVQKERVKCACGCHTARCRNDQAPSGEVALAQNLARSRAQELEAMEATLVQMSELFYELAGLNETLLQQVRNERESAMATAAELPMAINSHSTYVMSFSVLLNECCRKLTGIK
jgi:hypothetical protein